MLEQVFNLILCHSCLVACFASDTAPIQSADESIKYFRVKLVTWGRDGNEGSVGVVKW